LRANPVVKNSMAITMSSARLGRDPVDAGHTPGHQSLLVRLPKRGAVVAFGDMVHFQENWTNRRIPARNFDRGKARERWTESPPFLAENNAQTLDQSRKAQRTPFPTHRLRRMRALILADDGRIRPDS